MRRASTARGPVPSQVIEDVIGVQKNSRGLRSQRSFRRPQYSMCVAIKQKVVSQRHRCIEPRLTVPLASKTQVLPKTAFRARRDNTSLNFEKWVATSPSAPNYSPSSTNMHTGAADLSVLRHICSAEEHDFNLFSELWRGQFMKANHQLCIKTLGGDWLLALDFMPDSACIMWPLEAEPLAGHPEVLVFRGKKAVHEPVLYPVSSLTIEACIIDFMGPLRMQEKFPAAAKSTKTQVHIVQRGPVTSLLRVAAAECFWDLGKTLLDRVARYEGVALPPGSSLCDLAMALVQHCLGLEEDDALPIVAKRFSVNDAASTWNSSLFEVEDALECLHHDDHKDFVEARNKAKAAAVACESFRADFRSRAEAVRARTRAKNKRARPQKDFPTTLSQAQAKAFLPPDCAIWRAVTHSAWAGHCKGYSRISAPWSMGEYTAMKSVIGRLWQQHLDRQGQAYSECPYKGLLDE